MGGAGMAGGWEASAEVRALLGLLLTPRVGSSTCKKIYDVFGRLAAAWEMNGHALRAAGITPAAVSAIGAGYPEDDVEAELARIAKVNARVIPFWDDEYPRLLKLAPDHPAALYVKGELMDRDALAIAVVGSRRSTVYGRNQARRLSRELARIGFTIVSGLAYGIDAEAHLAALDAGGRTLAVLGCGLSQIYPPDHAELAVRIAEHGALISELPMSAPPDRQNFAPRNRIISGLSLGTLVVEAAERSGSLVTARWALEQGRDVFAVPGSVTSEASRGCHQLIRDGAHLVETAEDIVSALGPLPLLAESSPPADPKAHDAASSAPRDAREMLLNGREREVFGCLSSDDPRSVDDLVEATGLAVPIVTSTLLALEMKHVIRQIPGQLYVTR